MKKFIILITITCLCIASFGQSSISFKPTRYLLNKDVEHQLKRFASNDSGVLRMSMGIKVTWDGERIFNQELDCFTQCILINDTITITGYMQSKLGWGFQLRLFKDSCFVYAFALSDGKIYKYTISDKTLLSYIPVPSLTQKVVLSKRPSFQKGERVAGYVDIVSNDFYYLVNKHDIKARIIVRAYFKTAPLIVSPL